MRFRYNLLMPELLVHAFENSWPTLKLVFVIYAIGLLIERVALAQPAQPWRNIAFNVGYAVPAVFLTHLLVPPLAAFTQPWIAQYGGWLPIRLPDGLGWQALQGLLYFLTFDLFYYGLHRAQHHFPWLWTQHKLHHADRSVNVTSGQRHHFLEEPIRVFVVMLPLGIVFDLPPPNIGWLWSALLLWGYVIHLNLRIRLGALTPVFAGPQWHRLHHSKLPQHVDVNFAAFFPLWDIVFGTYVRPRADEWPDTGTHDGADMNHIGTALLSPFSDGWRALRARSRPR